MFVCSQREFPIICVMEKNRGVYSYSDSLEVQGSLENSYDIWKFSKQRL